MGASVGRQDGIPDTEDEALAQGYSQEQIDAYKARLESGDENTLRAENARLRRHCSTLELTVKRLSGFHPARMAVGNASSSPRMGGEGATISKEESRAAAKAAVPLESLKKVFRRFTSSAAPDLGRPRDGNGAQPSTFTLTQFQTVLTEDLQVDLQSAEISRIFRMLDKNGRGELTLYDLARGTHRFAGVRELVLRASIESGFVVPTEYDYTRSTSENYRAPLSEGFHGEFLELRASLDYGYHVNYSRERQMWQDSAIRAVVRRTSGQLNPWIVYTCGPMGAGKGYTLSWMSANGFFPLEHIVHIDPDYFKRLMPEFKGYVAHADETVRENAGTLCHRESGLIQEIAQEVAMGLNQNIWIDGSLRDGEWFSQVFTKVRQQHPQYKIAIFSVSASKQKVTERVKRRAEATGRAVPAAMLEDSFTGMAQSLSLLTPLVDFVARIRNEGDGPPQLISFEEIDHSGNWAAVKDRFARTQGDPRDFPRAMAPMVLLPITTTTVAAAVANEGSDLPAVPPMLSSGSMASLGEDQQAEFAKVDDAAAVKALRKVIEHVPF